MVEPDKQKTGISYCVHESVEKNETVCATNEKYVRRFVCGKKEILLN